MIGQQIDHSIDCALPWCDTTCALPDEHMQVSVYTPATLSLGFEMDTSGCRFPAVGVGIVWDKTVDRDALPAVSLDISGPNVDADAELRLDEAKRVRAALDVAIQALEYGEVW